jgi:hypothetical protein
MCMEASNISEFRVDQFRRLRQWVNMSMHHTETLCVWIKSEQNHINNTKYQSILAIGVVSGSESGRSKASSGPTPDLGQT